MSIYWGYHCKDCDVSSDTWFNHGEQRLKEFYYTFIHLKQMHLESGYISISLIGDTAHEASKFLEEHHLHDVWIRNEYDEIEYISPHSMNHKTEIILLDVIRYMHSDKSIREETSEYCHSIWSDWMNYLFSKGIYNPDGTWTMPKWAVDRWSRQMNSSYQELSDEEKDSDREIADGFLDILYHEIIIRREGER